MSMKKTRLNELVAARLSEQKRALGKLDDGAAVDALELFPLWRPGAGYDPEDRVRYGGKLYRVVIGHTSQEGWTPDQTPALFTEIAKPGEIPVWRQPTGAQDAYSKGDKVHYPDANGSVYESLIDANVYSPEAYPAGWRAV